MMSAMRGIAVVAAILLVLPAGARDAKATYDLIKRGTTLSATDATKLEEQLKANPGDEDARIQLLYYYAGPPADTGLSSVKAARATHILWLIENDPKEGLALFQISTGVYRLHCQGDELADSEAFGRASQV